ncbi:MAG TPA: YceI family protein [Candidatus Acidoferrales bacterium]|jgi:polyisoprenoid-binding protein YceI|nr:YceI family protein [Candidatus Acidoferrales bacterium]
MKGPFLKAGMIAGLAAAIALPASAGTTTYQIDPRHSSAGFGVTHLMISTVRGEFHGVTGTVIVDDSDIGKSSVNVTIDATTVDTREPDRDKHLKSEAFFDVAKYPTIAFQSTKVERSSDGSLKVTGDLTIRGVTKTAVLTATLPKAPIKDPWGLQRTAVSASTKINRQEFGVAWNQKLDSGGVVVGDDVNITLDVEMIIPPQAK